jgi:aldehyde:ferredoxin oxidoreductase
MKGGYAGNYLEVNLTEGSCTVRPLDPWAAHMFIGGQGYANWLLWTLTDAGVDPLGSENCLIVSTGPITGVAGGTDRGDVTFKSPLTGLWGNSQFGGFWCSELKFAGYDGVILRGVAEHPVYVWIKDDEPTIMDARHIWGSGVAQTDQLIKTELHDRMVKVLCIGPAGENLCREASLVQNAQHFAARTGGGAVLGAKNVKAIAVRGTQGMPPLAHPDECFRLSELDVKTKWSERALHSRMYRWLKFGPQASHVERADHGIGIFHNFEEGDHPDSPLLGGPRQLRMNRVRDDSCTYCPVGCIHASLVRSGVMKGAYAHPKWDSTANIAQQTGMFDINGMIYCNALCNELGMDAEGVGNTVAWAMECYDKGILSQADLDGLDLRWGNVEAEAKLIWKICHRDGVGEQLADGFKHFLPRVGQGSADFAMQSKGCGLGGYQPYAWHTFGMPYRWGVVYAVNDIGGHHNTASASGYWANSLTYCSFATGLTDAQKLALLNAATGYTLTYPEDWQLYGLRFMLLARAYNIREGYGGTMPPADADVLPTKAFKSFTYGAAKGEQLTRDEWVTGRSQWYQQHGCDERGVPTKETLQRVGLDFTIRALEHAGAWC